MTGPGQRAGDPEPPPVMAPNPDESVRPADAEGGTREAGPRAPGWALSQLNTGGLLYGTIVSAAALAVGAGRGDTVGGMTETMATTLIIYWLAHVYTATVTERGQGGATPLHRLVAKAAREESAILVGGLPALIVVVILALVHVSLWVTVLSDLSTAILVLALDGLLAGLHAGVRGWRLGVEAASAAVFGGLIALLLVSLHRH